jgi:AcrR family transcriptional regulator
MAKTTASTGERRPLTRERIVRAALDLADREGLEALTMRRLADELGAGAMSLYNHVANKEQLLDAIVDAVYAEISVPEAGADWKAASRAQVVSAREAIRRHRWAISVMESRTTPGPASLRYHDAALGNLRAAGFSPGLAIHAFWLLDSFVYGFALQEETLPFESAEDLPAMASAILDQFPAEEYPHLAESGAHVTSPGYDYTEEFDFGLDLILEGLEQTLHRSPPPR